MNTATSIPTLLVPVAYSFGLVTAAFNRTCPCMSRNEELENVIEEKYGNFIREHLGDREIHVTEDTTLYSSSISGDTWSSYSQPIIRLPAHLKNYDGDALGYLLKLNVSRLKYHDSLISNSVGTLLTAPGATLSITYSNSLAAFGSFSVGLIAALTFSYLQEHYADAFAHQHSTDDELKGSLCFYLAEWKIRSEKCYLRWIPFLNRNYCAYFEPSGYKRIYKIIKTLHQRNIRVITEDELLKSCLIADDKRSLLSGDNEIFDLDSPEVISRIASLQGILNGHNIPV